LAIVLAALVAAGGLSFALLGGSGDGGSEVDAVAYLPGNSRVGAAAR